MNRRKIPFVAAGLVLQCALWPMVQSQAQPLLSYGGTVYSTGFEIAEGYDPELQLVGQNNWVGFGSGGNGIITNFFEGYGQQAYIGFAPPAPKDEVLNVWRPIGLAPINPILKTIFSRRLACIPAPRSREPSLTR